MERPQIVGAAWFASVGMPVIGIVVVASKPEDLAFIGTANGFDPYYDSLLIMKRGAPFPLAAARQIPLLPVDTPPDVDASIDLV
jgi:hypothetical protein